MADPHNRTPAGERLSALEENARHVGADIAELKATMRNVEASAQRIENALARQRGAEGVKRVLVTLAQTLGGGAAGAIAAHVLGAAR